MVHCLELNVQIKTINALIIEDSNAIVYMLLPHPELGAQAFLCRVTPTVCKIGSGESGIFG